MVRSEHPGTGDALIPAAVHLRRNHMLKHRPVGHPAAVTARRMRRVKARPLSAQQHPKLDPDRLQQACLRSKHGTTSMIKDLSHAPVIKPCLCHVKTRPAHPNCRAL